MSDKSMQKTLKLIEGLCLLHEGEHDVLQDIYLLAHLHDDTCPCSKNKLSWAERDKIEKDLKQVGMI